MDSVPDSSYVLHTGGAETERWGVCLLGNLPVFGEINSVGDVDEDAIGVGWTIV